MVNAKALVHSLLTGSTALATLVPASSIKSIWPDVIANPPLIVHQVTNSFVGDVDIFDDKPICDMVSVDVHAYVATGKSTSAIFDAINTVMEGGGWNREGFAEMVDSETKMGHIVTRWGNVLYR